MSKRTLQATAKGIELAKRALERKNLTQKALAVEMAIAAWSTVNRFFTGKRIYRSIFMEICHVLDLDWQQIVSPETEPEPEPIDPQIDELLVAIERSGARARAALNPYILPPIPRETLLSKCLKEIRAGVFENKRRIVPILGAAGYGKSTILGSIYDELHAEQSESGNGWLALARCDDLIESAETFALELGEKISGKRQSIMEIAQQLTAQQSRGILLIDTLDIVLTKPLVPVLRGILSQLLEMGTTVVFTCRDTDYSNFFEPYHESFAGFRESVSDNCKITPFTGEEVKTAAQEFIKTKPGFSTLESQQSFANKIIALSADSVSLQEIVCHPLLLALLCELFAAEETVPEDLTVSQLYEKYWDWKIAKVRHNLQSGHLSLAKQKLCLKLARLMYESSGERLRDFVYEGDLDLSETDFSAYNSLKSDGILKELGGKRYGFFHQTFLEYAVARWMNTSETGERAKDQLKNDLIASKIADSRYYIWSIFRQLLTLLSLPEFSQISQELDTTKILPFRALTFASVSRTEPESSTVLLSLLGIALIRDYSFQETLLAAARGAPQRHRDAAWEVAVQLLGNVGPELINKAAETAAELLGRFPPVLQVNLESPAETSRFERALAAIANRQPQTAENNPQSQTAENNRQPQTTKNNPQSQTAENSRQSQTTENKRRQERYQIWGKFIGVFCETYANKRTDSIDLEILKSLKKYYFLFGGNVRSTVIELYLTPGIPATVQREFLLTIISQPISEQFKEQENTTKLLSSLLPNFLAAGDTLFGTTWQDALRAPLGKYWTAVSATAVGRAAASDTALLEAILKSTFSDSLPRDIEDLTGRNLAAITSAVHSGATDLVAASLLKIPIETIPANRASTITLVFRELAIYGNGLHPLSSELQLGLVQWIMPAIDRAPVEFIRAIDALANNLSIQQLLAEILEQLLPTLPASQTANILKKLNNVPPQLEPYLQKNADSKEVRSALIKLYRQQAENNSQTAISELAKLCLDQSRDVALDASAVLLALAEQKKPIELQQLLPVFAKSPLVGARQNCLKAFIETVNSQVVATSENIAVFETLENDSAAEIVQLLYKLIETAIWNHPSGIKAMEFDLAKATFELTNRIVKSSNQELINMGAASALIAFNQIALLEKKEFMSQIGAFTRTLLRITDISRKVDKLVVTGLLTKIAKFDSEFLASIVREDFIASGSLMPVANQCAVAVAVANDCGKNSPLLDEILNDCRIPNEVKSRIIRDRET
ncbi:MULTISPECIES: NACHT domain-containing protein [unclassified Microcoleus]|uniref:NACHT domain-containing protein n=1 Tax=unclassified Microcoleus TaxID=2642155 RepID=UPI002FD6BA31